MKKMLRPEQKPISLMTEEITTYSNADDIVFDLFGGTFSTGKACLQLPGMRRHVACEKHPKCFQLSVPTFFDCFATKCVEENCMQLEENKIKDMQEYLSLRKVMQGTGTKSKWEPPVGVPQFQCMSDYVVSTLCNLEQLGNLYNGTAKSPVDKWSLQLRTALDKMDVRHYLRMEAGLRKLCLRRSTIQHPIEGEGVFALRDFQEKDFMASYYGTLVFEDLYNMKYVTKQLGDGVLSVRKNRFRRCALKLNGKIPDRTGKRTSVWIAPAPFCIGAKINDPRYLEGDKE